MTAQQKKQLIETARRVASALLEFEELHEQLVAIDALTQLSDSDFTGSNAGITKADFAALFSAPWAAVETLLAQTGVKTVLYKLIET